MQAIDSRMQRPAVVRIHSGKVERVEVTLGMRDNHAETVQIASGVTAGDTLLVSAAQGITPATPVRVQPPRLRQTIGLPCSSPTLPSSVPSSPS